tara:strand:+ start:164 stop:775 length:612 start_codon:yes stop_codon:yes gene_type:complete
MKKIYKRSHLLKDAELRFAPVVIRVQDFTPKSAKEFSDQMQLAHNTGQPIIPIVIDSYGGQVYSLMAMISEIQNSSLPVATIVQGKAMSCGAILSTFGAENMRYIDPCATVMIHDVSSMAWGKIEELKSSSEEADRLNKIVYQMMAKNCKQKKNYFLDIVHSKGHADWYLDAEECLSHNISQHTTLPTLEVSIDVAYSFGHGD